MPYVSDSREVESSFSCEIATLADEPDANLNLMPEEAVNPSRNSHVSIFSFADSFSDPRYNPYDISRYVDRVCRALYMPHSMTDAIQTPLIVQTHSPLELVQQLFVKLGASQLLVTDARGVFRGMITKKGWLIFLAELEGENL